MKHIVIIGGGAAGIFAAINAAQNSNCKITVIEKSGQLLSKVKVSGGGRCNVTHYCFDVNELVKNYPRGNKELIGPFHRFNPKDTIDWFLDRGVKIKSEEDGRMFPVSNTSQTIIDCFLNELQFYKVEVRTNTNIQSIKMIDDGFELMILGKKTKADKLLIATGGNSQGCIYDFLKESGHQIIPLIPSLFTFNIPKHSLNQLQGISVDDAEISLPQTKMKRKGALLFTHWGISGPAVLKLSAFAAKELYQLKYNFEININFLPNESGETIKNKILQQKQLHPKQKVCVNSLMNLPKRLWHMLAELSGIATDLNYADMSKQQIDMLIKNITAISLKAKGKTTFKDEFVTCGGIALSDINFKSMESKKVNNLFFAGEVIDVDGITGGFNFQNAWTTGIIAAEAMAT